MLSKPTTFHKNHENALPIGFFSAPIYYNVWSYALCDGLIVITL